MNGSHVHMQHVNTLCLSDHCMSDNQYNDYNSDYGILLKFSQGIPLEGFHPFIHRAA